MSPGMKSLFRPFPLPLTGKQWFYLGFLQGFGAGIIDFGANFGIAYAMYHNQSVVKMWVFSQNTIAGDLGVTPIIQCLASMLISSTLVHSDLHSRQIQPLPFCYPHVEHLPDPRSLFFKETTASAKAQAQDQASPKRLSRRASSGTSDGTVVGSEQGQVQVPGQKAERAPAHESLVGTGSGTPQPPATGFWHYYWMLVRFIFEGTEKNMLLARPGLANWFGRLAWTAAQGAAIGIVFGFPIWCLAVVILGPIYGTRNMGGTWAPQAIKGVYGAVVGWVTNPVIATLALGSQAEHHLIVVEHDEEKGPSPAQEGAGGGVDVGGEAMSGEGGSGMEQLVPTIHEEEELDHSHLTARRFSPAPPSPTISMRGGRSRAASAASTSTGPAPPPSPSRSPTTSVRSRPPLTANVSHLSPLPSPSIVPLPALAPPFRLRDRAESSATSSYSYRNRPRGTSNADSTRSYSYALGGTGGRAQRSRSNTAVSAMSLSASLSVPPVLISRASGEEDEGGETAAGVDELGRSPGREAAGAGGGLGLLDAHRSESLPGTARTAPSLGFAVLGQK